MRLVVLGFLLGLAWAQPVEVGLEATPNAVAFTVAAQARLADWTVSGWTRLPFTEGASVGVGAAYALEFGPAGRGEVAGRGFVDLADGGYWVEGRAAGALGGVALEGTFGYSTRLARRFWPEAPETQGGYAALEARYRLVRTRTLEARLGYGEGRVWGEALLEARARSETQAWGVGVREGPYAAARWKGRVEEGLVEVAARVGSVNELGVSFFTREVKVTLTLALPPTATVRVTRGGYWVWARAEPGAYALWGGYRWELGGR
ncbi:hypothetical protein [Marinithermus hydrothermalis]|uniref:Cellulose biosynthesis protein BcsS n=1 Tax=Marinithermus hydrothermalis (strain DSM 14884 / JCM 11576 / T1) TaxID=869210 RepID=F2NNG9_MARHT|nr:hypothetical protein [Marinithermus hydrothermalis]AEB10779.1 hypothetical protein Marky_0014 [Marinithermus hydrothermalis DSM 14884]